jgi:hypothetical protein
MVDEMPAEERVRRTNLLFRTRRRTTDDALAQLIHDDDQILAACAIHLAAGRMPSELTNDVEYALTHRPPADWYVFEAASWALAGARIGADDRRARWLEPLPTVELADRLRHVPLFDYVSVDELVRFAAAARQVRYDRGRTVYDAGLVPATLQVLIEGEVHLDNGAKVTAPGPLAFEELLAGRPVARTMQAADVSVTLSLSQDEFLTLLFDNIDVAHGLFRMAFQTGRGADWRGVARGVLPDVTVTRAEDGLQPMERALLLQASPLAANATSNQLMRLALIATEAPVAAGAVLADEGDDAAIYLVVSGSIALEVAAAPPLEARPGDAIGLYETLTAARTPGRIVGRMPGIALRIDGRELFDLLATDIELLQGLFGALLRVDSPAAEVQSAAPLRLQAV